ncbi:uncharacterized protein EV154DRAFT_568844 [Mucor mucedo]|uniref:uncharacterized protein n=1 Tax=Mucor mucedo TaxID=29922 RepID=UPI00221E8847|nr:uncharacterized protein EV154DRAFT_568844 [Mucor mucedo]KAI7878733.1 hypothetical protein EV154DRAFT_568844 [Mucor mucedo]
MRLNRVAKIVAVFLGLSFISIVQAVVLSEGESSNVKYSERLARARSFDSLLALADRDMEVGEKSHIPIDLSNYLETKQPPLNDTILTSYGNPAFNEMFDNITDNYPEYSKFLENASTREIMNLRLKVMTYYKSDSEYGNIQNRFDNFIRDFRPKTVSFDKFCFSIMDYLIFPGLGVESYSPVALAGLRKSVVSTIPRNATAAQRRDFVGVVDDIIFKYLTGEDISSYSTNKA